MTDPRKLISEAIMKLDGKAAVNLAEPSPGDLERIYKAYCKTLDELARYKQALEKAKEWLDEFCSGQYRDHNVDGQANQALIEIDAILAGAEVKE